MVADPLGVQALAKDALTWTETIEVRMNEIMACLPPELHQVSSESPHVARDVAQATLATQRVNLGVLHRLIDYRIVGHGQLTHTHSLASDSLAHVLSPQAVFQEEIDDRYGPSRQAKAKAFYDFLAA